MVFFHSGEVMVWMLSSESTLASLLGLSKGTTETRGLLFNDCLVVHVHGPEVPSTSPAQKR